VNKLANGAEPVFGIAGKGLGQHRVQSGSIRLRAEAG
jgi:hypothetical protein